MLLQLEGVVKRYRRGTEEVVALDGVDLTVGPGESVAVVGPSGSGKSTLLHLAGGLDLPDAGTVRLDGRDLATLSLRDRARVRRRDVGFVFQFFHLVPSLTVAENVELPLLLEREGANGDGRSGRTGGRRARRRRVAELLDRVGVAERSGHLPGELSGGELQRAAIARALAAGPRLVLADEPTGNLDSATGRTVLDLLFGLVGDGDAPGGDAPGGDASDGDPGGDGAQSEAPGGTALVMVTHDEGAASRAGRIVRVRDGRLATPA